MKVKVRRRRSSVDVPKYKYYKTIQKADRNLTAKIVRIDNEQMDCAVEIFQKHIDNISIKMCEKLSHVIKEGKTERCDLFSRFVKVCLSSLLTLSGIVFFVEIILNWGDFWPGGVQNWATAILLIYCVIFIVLGVDIWREKDRNYLLSVSSLLVALAALGVALLNAS